VAEHGRLRVQGNRIVGQHGQPVRLRGMSFFWSQWMAQYWNKDLVHWMRSDWKVSVLRAAMGVEMGGHLENPKKETQKVVEVVKAAIQEGIYIIIDWHDHNANQHQQEASSFFDFMAREFGHFPNVLFETFNEPVQQSWSREIKPYHQALVGVIRQHSSNIIILGTRLWSQAVDEASQDPVSGEDLAYTLHFYASTHKEDLRNRARTALRNNKALFVTEWGTCEASGDGALNFGEVNNWMKFLEENKISDVNWAISDKAESCSALRGGASSGGGWSQSQLTQSGAFVRNSIAGKDGAHPDPSSEECADPEDNCRSSLCCKTPGWKCFEKDAKWAGCRPDCSPGIHSWDPWEYRTPWTCKLLTSVNVGPTGTPTPVEPAPQGSPVQRHGRLKVQGNKIVDEHGQPVRLRGMSFFWSQWMGQYWNTNVVRWLKQDWKVSLLRAAMGVEMGGHLENPKHETQKVVEIVKAAIQEGIYIIIDWHDHNANQHQQQASEFFDFVAREFGQYPNVLFETFNEPVEQSWSKEIKPYHQALVGVIRQHSSNIIILGTRLWSQAVDEASQDPVAGENLAYTLHFYASTHKEDLRNRARTALRNNKALFVTEWGTCEASGNGALNFGEVSNWMKFLDENSISDANWAISDKAESCSALQGGASATGGWPENQLTQSGAFVRNSIRGRSDLVTLSAIETDAIPSRSDESQSTCLLIAVLGLGLVTAFAVIVRVRLAARTYLDVEAGSEVLE